MSLKIRLVTGFLPSTWQKSGAKKSRKYTKIKLNIKQNLEEIFHRIPEKF
jgi:hypothetical protein